MSSAGATRWTVIRAAAAGDAAARTEFAGRYAPVVRAYLGARWRGSALAREIDDAAQDVFVDCLREDGALGRADSQAPGGFRAFLFGVTRNVARRVEERRRREGARAADVSPDDLAGAEETASRSFDREWAQALVAQAKVLFHERARRAGEDASGRADLLRQRFEEDLPIREIAARRGIDASRLHSDYARAKREFHDALRDVVRDLEGGSPADVERECARLVELLK